MSSRIPPPFPADTTLELSPEGRLFIAEQAGTMEVWQNGGQLQANFFRDTPLTVDSTGERGLLGIAFEGEKEISADPVQPAALGYLPGEEEPLSVALVPVVHRGKTRGLLACHRPSGAAFSKEEMALLRRCAGPLSIEIWPPSLPSEPTSRATRVTSEANPFS